MDDNVEVRLNDILKSIEESFKEIKDNLASMSSKEIDLCNDKVSNQINTLKNILNDSGKNISDKELLKNLAQENIHIINAIEKEKNDVVIKLRQLKDVDKYEKEQPGS